MPINDILFPDLPITEILGKITATLQNHHQLVLEAPPGAGKTTLVPLAILKQQLQTMALGNSWLQSQTIIMLEPRRMAAKAVAQRMAALLNEPVGQTVGYRVRQESKVSHNTRIEIITEGILTRRLLHDPALDGVGLVIFDEFHERSLDADTGLALTLQSRLLFREAEQPLRIMVMSATLDGEAMAKLLDDAPLIRSAGRQYPVTVHYAGKPGRYSDRIIDNVSQVTTDVLSRHDDSVLVFLPGQREINKAISQIKASLTQMQMANTVILPLYGALPFSRQQEAIAPLPADSPIKRKVVLATDIAETSLTIEGIAVVIDSGLRREAFYDPGTAMTRLKTQRISKASSVQRMGRAGRTKAGSCYRLWTEDQHQQLAEQSRPEILQADLCSLILNLLVWGTDDIHELQWLDTPPQAAVSQALQLLHQLGAISSKEHLPDQTASSSRLGDWQLSHNGQLMAELPVHPRLAHMLLRAAGTEHLDDAVSLAALLTERRLPSDHSGCDISYQLDRLDNTLPCPARFTAQLQSVRRQANRYKQIIKRLAIEPTNTPSINPEQRLGYLLACAYPDRIAKRKSPVSNIFQLSNGRQAQLDKADPLVNQAWLAVAELGGNVRAGKLSSNDTIYSATALAPSLFDQALNDLISSEQYYQWSIQEDRFIAQQQQYIGKLLLTATPLSNVNIADKNTALLSFIKKQGLDLLPWQDADRQWQARVLLLRSLENNNNQQAANDNNQWPDITDIALLNTLDQWLAPYLDPIDKISQLKRLDLQTILNTLLPWSLNQQLNQQAPTSIKVPSGSIRTIDYLSHPPVLKVKLQEMFGCETTPTIAQGKVKLMVHLLSPAGRPLQITQDLAGFWQNAYNEVKKEMKGRYPKHPWPDDPLQALATKHTKRRSQAD